PGSHPHPPQCAHWGTFPLRGGRLQGGPGVPPLRRNRGFMCFVGAHIVRPWAGLGPAPTVFEEVPAYPVGAGVLTGPHVCGTFLVIGGGMRPSEQTASPGGDEPRSRA